MQQSWQRTAMRWRGKRFAFQSAVAAWILQVFRSRSWCTADCHRHLEWERARRAAVQRDLLPWGTLSSRCPWIARNMAWTRHSKYIRRGRRRTRWQRWRESVRNQRSWRCFHTKTPCKIQRRHQSPARSKWRKRPWSGKVFVSTRTAPGRCWRLEWWWRCKMQDSILLAAHWPAAAIARKSSWFRSTFQLRRILLKCRRARCGERTPLGLSISSFAFFDWAAASFRLAVSPNRISKRNCCDYKKRKNVLRSYLIS